MSKKSKNKFVDFEQVYHNPCSNPDCEDVEWEFDSTTLRFTFECDVCNKIYTLVPIEAELSTDTLSVIDDGDDDEWD